MIISWMCRQCGWMNDNNMGACYRCGGDEDAKGRIKVASDRAKIAAFDGVLKARETAAKGGRLDKR